MHYSPTCINNSWPGFIGPLFLQFNCTSFAFPVMCWWRLCLVLCTKQHFILNEFSTFHSSLKFNRLFLFCTFKTVISKWGLRWLAALYCKPDNIRTLFIPRDILKSLQTLSSTRKNKRYKIFFWFWVHYKIYWLHYETLFLFLKKQVNLSYPMYVTV